MGIREEAEIFAKAFEGTQLKDRIGDFSLTITKEQDKHFYHLFTYKNQKGWRWEAAYDYEVEDFTVFVTIGLVTFKDLRFIKPKGEEFMNNLLAHYEEALLIDLGTPERRLSYAYKKKGIQDWEYKEVLPDIQQDFHLLVNPKQGILGINGTYIIGQYKHTNKENGIVFCYNVLRDEFFAEIYKDGHALMTHEYDGKHISELEDKISKNLPSLLASLH